MQSRISEEEKFKYCESYFFIINDFFARNFGHFLPTTFSYNISKDIADKIKKNISEIVGKDKKTTSFYLLSSNDKVI